MTVCGMDSSAQDRDNWQALLNTNINFWVKKIFWISCPYEELSGFVERICPMILTSCMGSISCIRPESTNPLKSKINLTYIYIYIFSSYHVINTRLLDYTTTWLMVHREIIAVCSDTHTEHKEHTSVWAER